MIPLNYHHLYYFCMTAKMGSIAKACQSLYLSQSAISAQLAQLERQLGCRLFDRRKQKLYLTEEGRFVLDYAESIFEMGQELQDNLKNRAPAEKLSVRIGILSGTARAFGHALLECALARFSSAHISVHEGSLDDLLSELKSQQLDVLLSSVSVRSQGRGQFLNHLVGKVPIVLTASPAIARRYQRIPRDLRNAPFILPFTPSDVYQKILDRLAEWKVAPRTVVEVHDVDLARHLAISGRGIAPINAYSASLSTTHKELVVLGSGKRLGLYESVYLVSRQRRWPNIVAAHLLRNFHLPTFA